MHYWFFLTEIWILTKRLCLWHWQLCLLAVLQLTRTSNSAERTKKFANLSALQRGAVQSKLAPRRDLCVSQANSKTAHPMRTAKPTLFALMHLAFSPKTQRFACLQDSLQSRELMEKAAWLILCALPGIAPKRDDAWTRPLRKRREAWSTRERCLRVKSKTRSPETSRPTHPPNTAVITRKCTTRTATTAPATLTVFSAHLAV